MCSLAFSAFVRVFLMVAHLITLAFPTNQVVDLESAALRPRVEKERSPEAVVVVSIDVAVTNDLGKPDLLRLLPGMRPHEPAARSDETSFVEEVLPF